jgi:hypothetical protein
VCAKHNVIQTVSPSALTWVPFEMVTATVFVACVLAVVSTAASGSEAVPVWNLI